MYLSYVGVLPGRRSSCPGYTIRSAESAFCLAICCRTRAYPYYPLVTPFSNLSQAEALSSLHTSGICHRSLCPEHVLIGADGHIVLTGFSRASVTAFNSPKSDHRNAIEEKDRLSKTSNMWSAPELILGWSHDFAVDCWGLGVLVYFMLTGQVSRFQLSLASKLTDEVNSAPFPAWY